MTERFATSAEIEGSLRASGVAARHARALAARAKPYVRLTAALVADDAQIPLGATKIGGAPDLPAGMPWPLRPAYADADGRIAQARADAEAMSPEKLRATQADTLATFKELLDAETYAVMAEAYAKTDFSAFNPGDVVARIERTAQPAPLPFVAQVDLAAVWRAGVVDADIPPDGRLLLFYDTEQMPGCHKPEDAAGWKLVYDTSPATALARAVPPPELAAQGDQLAIKPQLCTLQSMLSTPAEGSPDWDACAIPETAEDAIGEWLNDVTGEQHDHRIGGHPLRIQADMQTQCALVSHGLDVGIGATWTSPEAERFKPDAENWVMLMQIASDRDAGMMWGDMGNLYVWIHRQALRARRFDEALVVFQCH
jgi:uncharacterized protein YwqG